MLPIMAGSPSAILYPVTTTQTNGVWIVTVGDQTYTFGEDGDAAQAFAALASAHTAALVEWTAQALELLRRIEDLLASAGKLQVLYADNKLFDLIMATPEGAQLPGVRRSLLRILSIGCFFQDITVFMTGNLVGVPPSAIPLGMRRAVITVRD